jgi:hypothetical protein
MNYESATDVDALVEAFEACTLPREEWTHAAHITVAVWCLMRDGVEAGSERVRVGIQRYNASQGIVTRPDGGGYHETLTRFYLWAVERHLHEAVALLAAECVARLDDRELPFRYYSRERLMSSEARMGWLAPDLQPFD